MASPKSKKSLHLTMISLEYNEACKKHPKFCDSFTFRSIGDIRDNLAYLRQKNSEMVTYADYILGEEILEAFEAFKKEDKKHCLQELAQCEAVILRMMQFVQDELLTCSTGPQPAIPEA